MFKVIESILERGKERERGKLGFVEEDKEQALNKKYKKKKKNYSKMKS